MTVYPVKTHSVDLELIQLKGMQFHKASLKAMLPNVQSALFFGKLFELDEYELGVLLGKTHNSTVLQALTGEGHLHSTDLQDYLVDMGYASKIELGEIVFSPEAPHGEILPELWESAKVDIAQSIKDVAAKLADIIGTMPGKQGEMVFKSMMTMNAKRPVIGDYKAGVKHGRQAANLVILDVSGSMSQQTVATIIDDVVALSWQANAHLAIVSNTTTVWGPGEYNSAVVLKAAEFGGTHYETLQYLLEQDWGVVVTIADFDSSAGAKNVLGQTRGSIDTVLDISLVDQPTYLAECVGQRAREVKPLLIAGRGQSFTS